MSDPLTGPDPGPHGPGASDDAPVLAWSFHPITARPVVSAFVIAVILLAVYGVWLFTGSAALTVVGGLAFLGSLASFFFPTRYEFTVAGVVVRGLAHTRRKPWAYFRSFFPERHGVLLSPYREARRMENFRGFYLPYAGRKDDILRVVSERLPRQ